MEKDMFIAGIGIDVDRCKELEELMLKKYELTSKDIRQSNKVMDVLIKKIFVYADEESAESEEGLERQMREKLFLMVKTLHTIDLYSARYMFIGYCLSKEWRGNCGIQERVKNFEEKSRLPFQVKKEWCREYCEVMFATNNIRLFEKSEMGDRIERYSFDKEEKICTEIYKKIIENEEKEIEEKAAVKSKIENYLLLDKTLGLTLTNCIFLYVKEMDWQTMNRIVPVIRMLARLRCIYMRNDIANVVFEYIKWSGYDNGYILKIQNFLETFVEQVNEFYLECLNIMWYRVIIDKKKEAAIKDKEIISEYFNEEAEDISKYLEEYCARDSFHIKEIMETQKTDRWVTYRKGQRIKQNDYIKKYIFVHEIVME